MCGRTACALAPATLQKVCSYRDPKTKKYRKPKWREHPTMKGSENEKLDVKYYPSYNIFPTRFTPILFKDQKSDQIVLQPALWKLIPPWIKGDPRSHSWSTFNCRIEGLETSKLFRPALVRRRFCVIPIQGFYEWKKTSKGGIKNKQPYFICTNQRKYGLDEIVRSKSWKHGKWNRMEGWRGPKIMFLAGLYSVWKGAEGELVYSYIIITKPANSKLTKIHRRMPVILKPKQLMAWLNPKEDKSLKEMIKPLRKSAPNVTPYTISDKVNSSRCNYEGCIERTDLKRKGRSNGGRESKKSK